MDELPRALPGRRSRRRVPGLVHPPRSSSTTSCCARAAPSCTSARRRATSRATATACGRSPACGRRHLVGAGGTHCPVARLLAPPRPMGPVGVQEHEFQADRGRGRAHAHRRATASPSCCCTTISAATPGTCPRPTGSTSARGPPIPTRSARPGRRRARIFWRRGHIPADAAADLEPKAMKGYAYYLYDPAHLAGRRARRRRRQGRRATCAATAWDWRSRSPPRGSCPPSISGRVCAEAILAGDAGELPGAPRRPPRHRRLPARLQAARDRGGLRASVGARRAPDGGTRRPARDGLSRRACAAAPSPPASPGCSRAPGCPRRS